MVKQLQSSNKELEQMERKEAEEVKKINVGMEKSNHSKMEIRSLKEELETYKETEAKQRAQCKKWDIILELIVLPLLICTGRFCVPVKLPQI